MDFVLFLVFLAYLTYNGFQVVAASNGKRFEHPAMLLFFGVFIDLYDLVKSKIG